MVSALDVFGDEFDVHARMGRCSVTGALTHAPGTRITATRKRIAAA
jgi:hypothetical protein